ncbi:MAG TPA: GNAT family N-acetyltransferase [Candidatus Angelobacter sp.]|nr:GNAT family N-acetyltransferase [Candidatus Angelobacter sp.]
MSDYEILVRELEPKVVADYLGFFDDIYDNDSFLRFRNNPWWGGCYCSFYDDPRTEDEINASRDKRSENRAAREKTIKKGKASGLLAYAGGKVIAWCNVAPRRSYVNARYLKQAIVDPNERVGSITCFVVSSEQRRSGVASKLLQSACELIKKWGLPIAEGYPRNQELSEENPYKIPQDNLSFRGSLNMFQRSGFRVHMKLETFSVVRKTV